MKISIVIPIYNIESYINKCLDSCINQTYRDLEIICVDDGSTDNSGIIADEYSEKDERIKVIHKKNGGLPSARKTGISHATGEYVFHLDGDDDIPLDAIENLFECSENGKIDIVIGSYKTIKFNGEESIYEYSLNTDNSPVEYTNFILEKGVFNIWGKLIRNSIYKNNKIELPPEIVMGEDLIHSFQLALHAGSVRSCNKNCYNYYIRKRSMSFYENDRTILCNKTIYSTVFLIKICNKNSNILDRYLVERFLILQLYLFLISKYPVNPYRKELYYIIDNISNETVENILGSRMKILVGIAKWNLSLSCILGKIMRCISKIKRRYV